MNRYRVESDVLGKVRVDRDAYYGPETQRAINNFGISGVRVPMEIFVSYAILKKAAAAANLKVGRLDSRRSSAISRACNFVIRRELDENFPIDIFQAGAGTCINMNVNEVIANKAIEILGGKRGDYALVNPNDHVNMSQSTNDTMPSALHIAVYSEIGTGLLPSLKALESELQKKTSEFRNITKLGRTHLQDAVPMTLGQEFSGYRWAVTNSIDMISVARKRLLKLPLGGTAVGNSVNAGSEFSKHFISGIRKMTGADFRIADNRFVLMQQRLEELAVSDSLKETATAIGKIANDLRLLNSGPRGGLGEISLPEIMPGSSIMPGKINPSIPEMVGMVCQRVIGSCASVTESANAGQLEINVFTPVIAYELMFSIKSLSNCADTFAKRCIAGITPNKEAIRKKLEMDLSIATSLNPYIGYAKASRIARQAYKEGKSIKQVCIELGILDRKTLERILDPELVANGAEERH